MPDKTKAALQGRQCSYKKLKPSQITTLIDQVNNLGRVANMQLGIAMQRGQAKRCDKKCIGHKLTAPLAQFSRDTRKFAHTGNSTYLKSFASWWVYPDMVQPFGSIPRDCSSFRIMRFIQAETDASPSWAKACLIPSSNAGSTRKAICLLPLPFISMVDIWLTPNYVWLVVKCMTSAYQKATPRSAETLPRRLTTNDRMSIEVAMLNHTPTRFKFLFLAVCRSDLNAKPHRESVTANSEQDARRSLAGQFVLSFAGRLPEVSHG